MVITMGVHKSPWGSFRSYLCGEAIEPNLEYERRYAMRRFEKLRQ
jgi:hypothetical protein